MTGLATDDYVSSNASIGGYSLEEILREYYGEPEAAAEPVDTETAVLPEVEETVETEQELTAPKTELSSLAEEAKSLFAGLSDEDYARLIAEEDASAAKRAELEIDPRFNLGSTPLPGSFFTGSEEDIGSDPTYKQKEQGFAIPAVNSENSDEEFFIDEKPRFPSFFKKKKRSVGGFRDSSPDDRYAPDLDYEGAMPDESEHAVPSSFREFLVSELSAVLIRLRGGFGRSSIATVEAEDEDLGPEVSVKNASKY